MKYYIQLLLLSVFFCTQFLLVNGQSFVGFYSADNTINLVPENPAFAMTKDRAEINVFGAGILAGGNMIQFKHDSYAFLTNGTLLPDRDYIKNPKADNRSMWLNFQMYGPGASFKIKKRYTVAITTGLRYLVNTDNLDNKVFNHLGVKAPADTVMNDNYNLRNYYYVAQLFREINLSYARYVYAGDGYIVVAGATLKLLQGDGAFAVGMPQMSFNSRNNDSAYNATGNINFEYTPFANRWALTNSPLNAVSNSSGNLGLGFDIGAVLTINYNPNPIEPRLSSYQARIAMSVTDIGGITYTAGSVAGSYLINNRNIDLKNIQNNSQTSFGNQLFGTYLSEGILKSSGNRGSFNVGLPTAFRFNADLNIIPDRFLVNTNILLNLRSPAADNFSNHYISAVTITPRYMYKQSFGWAMPITYNVANQGSLGAVAMVGSWYVGCSSFFNTLISNSFNTLSLYTGLAVRIKPRRVKEKDMMMMW
jgi:hypothetical protein